MTKRHFEAFAREIYQMATNTTPGGLSNAYAAAAVVIQVAEQFNPRFDRNRFMKACGLN